MAAGVTRPVCGGRAGVVANARTSERVSSEAVCVNHTTGSATTTTEAEAVRERLSGQVLAGELTSPRGLGGWLRVYSWTDPPQNIFSYPEWSLVFSDGTTEVTRPEQTLCRDRHLSVKLPGCNDRDGTERYRGCRIYIAESALGETEENQFYWYHLEGLQVLAAMPDGHRVSLGRIRCMNATGANDVMVVAPAPGSTDNRERLIPWLEERVILQVDLDEKTVLVNWDPEF